MWGGELVSLSERKELAALERRRGSDPELYWYESETCQLFSFATSLERGDCASLHAFICVRSNEKSEVVEVEPTIYHEKEEEEAEEARIAAQKKVNEPGTDQTKVVQDVKKNTENVQQV